MASQSADLQLEKALVTGATSGIGRAVALQLARQGAAVLVHGKGRSARGGGGCSDHHCGGSGAIYGSRPRDPADLQRLTHSVGDIDVLVNNAGFSWFGPTLALDVETFDALFASNVRAPFFLVAAFAPRMAAKGNGSIIDTICSPGSSTARTMAYNSSPDPRR